MSDPILFNCTTSHPAHCVSYSLDFVFCPQGILPSTAFHRSVASVWAVTKCGLCPFFLALDVDVLTADLRSSRDSEQWTDIPETWKPGTTHRLQNLWSQFAFIKANSWAALTMC